VADFVEICNVCARKVIIEAAKRIINSDKVCHSYSDLNFGVTFFGTQCTAAAAASVSVRITSHRVRVDGEGLRLGLSAIVAAPTLLLYFLAPIGVIDSAPLAGCYIKIRQDKPKADVFNAKISKIVRGEERATGRDPSPDPIPSASRPITLVDLLLLSDNLHLTSRLPGTANPLNFIQTT